MKRKVFYKSIMIEGFQSFGKRVVFKLDRNGLNLIKGQNGVGKSTIFNAILWCEYGGNLKKSIETWKERRPADYKGTRVVVERTDGKFDYRIVRHLKYKGTTFGLVGGDKLMIYKKSVDEPKFTAEHLLGDGLHKSDMQLLINEQIGMDEQTFLNSIMFGQRVKSLIEAPNADKRKLFEELFNLDFVEEAKEIAKEKYAALQEKIQALTYKLEGAKRELFNAQENLKREIEFEKEWQDQHEQILHKLNSDIQSTKEEFNSTNADLDRLEKESKKYDLSELEAFKEEVRSLEQDWRVKNGELADVKVSIGKSEREIRIAQDKLGQYHKDYDHIETNCPYCNSELSKDKVEEAKRAIDNKADKEKQVIEKLGELKQEKEKQYASLDKELKELELVVNKNRAELSELQNNSQRGVEIAVEIRSLKKQSEALKQRIEKLTNDYTTESKKEGKKADRDKYNKIITDCEALLKNGDTDLQNLQEEADRVDWWVKKGFGSGGLKSFVFNAMLNQMNIYAQRYASRLGFRVEFSVDMTKASKPFQTLIYDGEFVRDYEDLSGGQKQRVDVCVAFAMHDLISHKSDINILVMDETTEGLDNKGIESFFDLVRQKAESHSVYLVTHSDIIDSLNCKSIVLGLDEDGNTEIIA
nr:MAG TPA: STRUCTURAL MAINTENANCE OF CHROMOSOMES PROTEIN [Herelleviridae sp.]